MQGLERVGDNPFEIHWKPFQLNPEMPEEGMDRATYLERKFGGKENALRVYLDIDTAAKESGLSMNFAGIQRTPNTMDAHRLIKWAALEGVQTRVVERLFKSYFLEGKDISKPSVLEKIGVAAGMKIEVLRRLLSGETERLWVRDEDNAARARGIKGVPFFIIDNHYAISGAQTATVWEDIISEICAKAAQI